MAAPIAITTLTSGSDTAEESQFTVASFSHVAGKNLIAKISTAPGKSVTELVDAAGTWVLLVSSDDATGGAVSLWYLVPTTTASSDITINLSDVSVGCSWWFGQWDGVKITGGGADGYRTPGVSGTEGVPAINPFSSLAAFAHANNSTLFVVRSKPVVGATSPIGTTFAPEAGWTEMADLGEGSYRAYVGVKAGNDTTPSCTALIADWACIGVEIAAQPVIATAQITAAGLLELVYTATGSWSTPTLALPASNFTLTLTRSAKTHNFQCVGVSLSAVGGTLTATCTLNGTVYATDTVVAVTTVAGTIDDLAGNTIQAESAISVTNNSVYDAASGASPFGQLRLMMGEG